MRQFEQSGFTRKNLKSKQRDSWWKVARVDRNGAALSISAKTLANWVALARHGEGAAAGDKRRPVTEAEVSRLKRELAEMKMERDLLKQCVAASSVGDEDARRR